jgi:hypothetical protein
MPTKKVVKKIEIKAPNFQTANFEIEGTTPFVQNKFSGRVGDEMKEKQEAGSTAKKGKKREAKNFEQCCEEAKHYSDEGWIGIPCTAFRASLVSACRVVGFTMALAKLCLFVPADGYDRDDLTPLVKITEGEPVMNVSPVRIPSSGAMDLRARPMWKYWRCKVSVEYDADQFTEKDVANLLMRAGIQVGVGEGRPDSKKSVGCGWGTFRVLSEKPQEERKVA